MEIELIRDGTIGTPGMLYATLRSGPLRIGSTPFCAIYETAGGGRTLIMRRGAESWEEADALAGAPHAALFLEAARLYYAHGTSIVEMNEAGEVIATITGPTVSGLDYPFAVARAAAQLAVLYSPAASQEEMAAKLWLEDGAEMETFPPAPGSGTGTFPVGVAPHGDGLHMAAAAGAGIGFVATVWYRAYEGGSLGAPHVAIATGWVVLAGIHVTSDGRIYIPYLDYEAGDPAAWSVKVAMGSVVDSPDTWQQIDVGPLTWGVYGFPTLAATLGPDGKTLYLAWTEDPDGDDCADDCYIAHGADGTFSAPAKLIGIDEFPVIQDSPDLMVEGAGAVASDKIGLLFSAGYGIGDVWHTFYGEVAAEPGGGARYRGWVM